MINNEQIDALTKDMLGDLSLIQCNMDRIEKLDKMNRDDLNRALERCKQSADAMVEINKIMEHFVTNFSQLYYCKMEISQPAQKKTGIKEWFKKVFRRSENESF